ncbi:integrase, catalytic region, zinc finger, CCHC-type containing protein [Tanacetum coccineum]
MLDKQNDLISVKHKINISPIDYSKLNKIKEDFGKRFVTKKEFSAEQAFWLKHSNYNPDTSVKSHTPIRIEAPSDFLRIKSLSGKDSVENVKKDIDEIETINIELEHSVAKLLSENENLRKEREHLKSIYKDQFDSIRKTLIQSKEHSLKNELRKLKGKNVVDAIASKTSATIAPGMFKLDIEPNSHRLKNNRDAHEVYLDKTIENTDTLCGLVEYARKQNPSEPLLEFAYAVTPLNKDKKVRFTSTKVVPTKETTNKSVLTPTQGIIVYSRRPKASKLVGSSSKSKITRSRISNSSDPTQSGGSIVFYVPSSSLNDCRFENDHIAKIMGYEYYQMGNVTISRVYNMERLRHNLFSVGQFCDSDLEVAFRKHTCFIRDLDGVDLLKGSRGLNLYTISMENLLLSSPICHLSKASKTKSWLWHRRLSHLNFYYITSLAKHGLVRGLPKLKYQKFTWVKFIRSKDEVPEFVIKFLKMLQVRLNATVRNIKTDNVPVVIALKPAVSTGTPSSTTIDQDAPSTSTSQTNQETPSPVLSLGVKEANHDIKVAHMDNNPYVDFPIPKQSSKESSSQLVDERNAEDDIELHVLRMLHILALLVMSKYIRICISFVILEVLLSEYFGFDMNYALNFFSSLPNRHPLD